MDKKECGGMADRTKVVTDVELTPSGTGTPPYQSSSSVTTTTTMTSNCGAGDIVVGTYGMSTTSSSSSTLDLCERGNWNTNWKDDHKLSLLQQTGDQISGRNAVRGALSPPPTKDFPKRKYIPPQRRVRSKSDEKTKVDRCGPPAITANKGKSGRTHFSNKDEMIRSIEAKFCTFTSSSLSAKVDNNRTRTHLTSKNNGTFSSSVATASISQSLETLHVGNKSKLRMEADKETVSQTDHFNGNFNSVDISGAKTALKNAFVADPTPVPVHSTAVANIGTFYTTATATFSPNEVVITTIAATLPAALDSSNTMSTKSTATIATNSTSHGDESNNDGSSPLSVGVLTAAASSLSPVSASNSKIPIHELVLQKLKKQNEAMSQKMKKSENDNANVTLSKSLFNREYVSSDILEQVKMLPIHNKRHELIELIRENQVIIIVGNTSCGKSTQIPQYIAEAGLHGSSKIGVTQPRRVAAKSLASRVADECGVELGTTVGYNVRFQRNFSTETVIKYMTDGMLVRECTSSEDGLDEYSIIMIDEAHERSINTDVCLGLLKQAVSKRPELKVIISSATLKREKFSQFFNNAPVFKVPGKSYEVQITYKKYPQHNRRKEMKELVDTIVRIHRDEPRGDILVFLPGQGEIEDACEMLEAEQRVSQLLGYDKLIITPCYAELPLEEQQKMFDKTPAKSRKVVLATNIAEISITIEGIVYVVDSGYFRQKLYDPKSGIYSLIKRRITKFQAIQRSGRAGRTCAGKCHRLYTEAEFQNMEDTEEPEITRCSLESMILTIIALGIADPQDFDYIDPPPVDAMVRAIIHLQELSAVEVSNDGLKITRLGQRMVEFPLDPPLAKVVIQSEELGCSSEVLRIVALLTFRSIFWRNNKNKKESDEAKRKFHNPDSDLLTLLNVYKGWENNNQSEDWCKSRYIFYHRLVEAEEIRDQIKGILRHRGMSENYKFYESVCSSDTLNENIRRAFTAGYFRQLAKHSLFNYVVIGDGDVHDINDMEHAEIHRSSSVVGSRPWVIYQEIMTTTKTTMREVTAINISWVSEYAPEYAKKVGLLV